MSGHSKWAGIKHKKALIDSRRGKLFSRLIREIMMSSRIGGENLENNPRLRLAVERAKEVNMPGENIKRAIQRGSGGEEGSNLEEVTYEGYGPGGVAIMLDVLTDNKRRTASEIRSIFSKYNGNLGENGCVSWLFERKGLIIINKEGVEEDTLFSMALEAGAEDMHSEDDHYTLITIPADIEKVRNFLNKPGIKIESSSITRLPKSTVKVEGKGAESLLKLLDFLEEDEDIQEVYSNFDMPDDILESTLK